jgi:hypothetical protein
MKYWNTIKCWFANLFKPGGQEHSPDSPQPSKDEERVRSMLDMIEKTRVTEIDCGEVYRLLDQYTEMIVRGEDPARLMPLVKQHLDLCMDCREEYEALLEILQSKQ